jgi:hypothetical protein
MRSGRTLDVRTGHGYADLMQDLLHARSYVAPVASSSSSGSQARLIAAKAFADFTRTSDADDRATSDALELLASALEEIAATTTDEFARTLAEDALALFQGR